MSAFINVAEVTTSPFLIWMDIYFFSLLWKEYTLNFQNASNSLVPVKNFVGLFACNTRITQANRESA
jgi:hypothetical protein